MKRSIPSVFPPIADKPVDKHAEMVGMLVWLDAAAPVKIVDSFSPALMGIVRYVQFPFVKFGVRGNKAGTTVNVWAI